MSRHSGNGQTRTDISPIQVQQHLKGIHYPAGRQELLKQAKSNKAPEEVVALIERMPDQTYNSPAEVSKAVGKAR
ncbi:MAG: DUF2795 domain-containing protein [Anaerolineae bacterium]